MTPMALTWVEDVEYFIWLKRQRQDFLNECNTLIDYYQTAFKSQVSYYSASGTDPLKSTAYDYVQKVLADKFRTQSEYKLMVLNECIRRYPAFIINKISMVEKKRPDVRVLVGGKKDDKLTEEFEAICQEMHLYQRFQQAEKYKNLLSSAFLLIHYDPEFDEGDRWDARLVTPATLQLRAKQGRPEVFAAALIEDVEQRHQNNKWEEETIYWYWTSDEHKKLDKNLKEITLEGNEEGANPYGLIPLVPFWVEMPIDVPIPSVPDDLLGFTEEMLAIQTANNSFQFMQGFSQLVASGPPDAIKELEVKTGLSHLVKIISTADEPATLTVLQYPDLLPSLIKFEQERLMQFALLHNISPSNFIVSAEAWSAQAIRMENLALVEKREQDVPMHELAWQRLFTIVKAICETEKLTAFPADAEISVVYPQQELPQTRGEKLEELEREMALDLVGLVEAYQRLNQSADDEEAEAAIQKIQDEKKANQPPEFGAMLEGKLAALRGGGNNNDETSSPPSNLQPGGDRK